LIGDIVCAEYINRALELQDFLSRCNISCRVRLAGRLL